MTAALLNGVTFSYHPPITITGARTRDARLQERSREMLEQPAFARSARWVGPAHEGVIGDIETATQLVSRGNFGDIPKHHMANRILERGLRIRILTGFTLVILLTLLIAGWSYFHISTLGSAAEHLFIENYRSIQYAHGMESALTRMDNAITNPELANDSRSADEVFRHQLALEFSNITEPGESDVAKKIESDYEAYRKASDLSQSKALSDQVRADCEAILGLNERAMFARSEAVQQQADFARYSTVGITILLVSVSIFLAVAVSRRSLAEFHELDRAKSNFVATAAHELKNPLSAIKTSSALLADGVAGNLTSKQNEMVNTINRESGRLLGLVHELLDLAKLETGTLALNRIPIEVETLLESAIITVAMRAEEKGVMIDLSVMNDVPRITVDPNKMSWAISNLLSNAVRYSPRGAAITASASAIESEVWISVSDRGRGIAEGDLVRIFDKFVQIEESSMGVGTGSGLGLAIAREIVEAHGGRIWATSAISEGSTFTIALPLNSKV
jgi:signal transduction histidine kinase